MDGYSSPSEKHWKYGAGRGNRTPDPRITNALLYQLSYAGSNQVADYKGIGLGPASRLQSRRLRTRMMTSTPSGCIPAGSSGSLEKATASWGMSCSSPLSTL
jgi:hypothetical protein